MFLAKSAIFMTSFSADKQNKLL